MCNWTCITCASSVQQAFSERHSLPPVLYPHPPLLHLDNCTEEKLLFSSFSAALGGQTSWLHSHTSISRSFPFRWQQRVVIAVQLYVETIPQVSYSAFLFLTRISPTFSAMQTAQKAAGDDQVLHKANLASKKSPTGQRQVPKGQQRHSQMLHCTHGSR